VSGVLLFIVRVAAALLLNANLTRIEPLIFLATPLQEAALLSAA